MSTRIKTNYKPWGEDESMARQWRWVRYKNDNNLKSMPMYCKDGRPTQAYVVFCAIDRMRAK